MEHDGFFRTFFFINVSMYLYTQYVVLFIKNFYSVFDVSDISSGLSVQLYQYRRYSPSCISWYVLSSGSPFV
jgi:hypothetical protein